MTAQLGENVANIELARLGGGVWRLDEDRGHWCLLIFHRHLG